MFSYFYRFIFPSRVIFLLSRWVFFIVWVCWWLILLFFGYQKTIFLLFLNDILARYKIRESFCLHSKLETLKVACVDNNRSYFIFHSSIWSHRKPNWILDTWQNHTMNYKQFPLKNNKPDKPQVGLCTCKMFRYFIHQIYIIVTYKYRIKSMCYILI